MNEIDIYDPDEPQYQKGFCIICGEKEEDCSGYKCWER
jgi:hypothetical protein